MDTRDSSVPSEPERSLARGPSGAHPETRIWVTTAFILAMGWSVAVAVYVTATPVVNDDLVDDWEHSRRYLLDLERIGGRAAVFGTELNQWVAGLWQGRSLAYTLAALTTAVALGYFFAARSRARRGGTNPGAPT